MPASVSIYPKWINRATNLREVAPKLYLASEMAAVDSKIQFGAILDVGGADVPELRAIQTVDVPMRLTWLFSDGDNIPPGLLETALPFVKAALKDGENVLVHCQAGLSRSPSVTYVILRKLFQLSHEEAFQRIYVSKNWPVPKTFASARTWVERGSAGR